MSTTFTHLRDKGGTFALTLALSCIVWQSGFAQESPSPSTPQAAATPTSQQEQMTSAAWLVSAEELAARLSAPNLRILDVRSEADYNPSHIPGAARIDINAWKNKSLAEGGLHDVEFWAKAVGDLGVTPETQVVVYGDSPTDAARAWWLLSYVGAPRVGLLDGGWAKWTAAKAPTSTDTPRIELARFEVKFQAERVIEEEALRQALTGNQAKIVDARTAGEFTDRGHLPGAVRLEWSELMADDGTYKTSDEIREMFAKLGLTNEAEIVTHCQTGARSSVEVFALELAGFGKVKNYYCGWSEWGADAQNPVEK